MDDAKLDRIHIRGLRLQCILGVDGEERRGKQGVEINIMLYADLRKAGQTDSIEATVDYRALTDRIAAMVEESSCLLVEGLAERIAALCLEAQVVRRVEVEVDKPGALPLARCVGVRLVRERGRDG